MINLVSILLGLAGGALQAWAVRGTAGRRRVRRAFAAGLPILSALLAWALWREAFPATFGPVVLVCVISSLAERTEASDRT